MARTLALVLFVLLLLLNCSDDSTGPNNQLTPAEVAGQYENTTFTLQRANDTIDILAVGGFIDLTLKTDLATEGRLFIPDTLGLTEDGDFDVSLQGTYAISDNTITFQHQADTFIRDAEWLYDAGKLSTNATFDDVTVIVELQRKQ